MAEEDDEFRGPNDNAYEKPQVRVGPPLEYVAEKLRHAIEATHHLLRHLRKLAGSETAVFDATYAFQSQLTAFLALNNLLALANEKGFFDRLEGYTDQQFKDWLDRISQQGSVT